MANGEGPAEGAVPAGEAVPAGAADGPRDWNLELQSRRSRVTGRADANLRVLKSAESVAPSVFGRLHLEMAVSAVIYELAHLGQVDPVFRILAGFGKPLPEWADWDDDAIKGALAGLDDAVKERVEQILESLRTAADEQLAEERVGEDFYGIDDK